MAVYVYSRCASRDSDATTLANLQVASDLLAVQTFALARAWTISETFDDSGCEWSLPLGQREQGAKLIAQLERGDTVVSARLEHLCGSVAQFVDLLEQLRDRVGGIYVVDLGLDVLAPESLISLHRAAGLFAELENRRYAERILNVKRRQREKGRFLGGSRPFGYSVHDNGRLIENPIEQRTVAEIRSLRQKGRSLRAIAAAVSTPLAPISFKTVQRVLQRLDAD